MEQIVFLTYIQRSGSTFLSKLLNEYKDIGVTIEARFPDGTKRGLLEIESPEKIAYALQELYSDEKFRLWNIDKEILRKRLLEIDFPISYDQVLKTIFKLYFKDSNPNVIIHKASFSLEYTDHIKAIFNDSKFIFLIRDARAIYNSQKSSFNTKSLKPMSNNPIITAKRYKKTLTLLNHYKEVDWFFFYKI